MANLTTLYSLLSNVALYHPHHIDKLATYLFLVLIALKHFNAADSNQSHNVGVSPTIER